MYTRFIFGKTGDKDRKDQEVHAYGTFLDPLSPDDGDLTELKWKTSLKIDQARLISKTKDATVNSTQQLLWAKGANCAFQLDDITVTRGRPQGPPHRTFTNQDPTYLHHLRTFGEVGICKNHAYSSSPSN